MYLLGVLFNIYDEHPNNFYRKAHLNSPYRASGRSRKKSQISRDFQGQIRGKNGQFCRNFMGIFEASFTEKTIGKEQPIL